MPLGGEFRLKVFNLDGLTITWDKRDMSNSFWHYDWLYKSKIFIDSRQSILWMHTCYYLSLGAKGWAARNLTSYPLSMSSYSFFSLLARHSVPLPLVPLGYTATAALTTFSSARHGSGPSGVGKVIWKSGVFPWRCSPPCSSPPAPPATIFCNEVFV